MWMIMKPIDIQTIPNIWTFNIDIAWKEDYLRIKLVRKEEIEIPINQSFDRIQFPQMKYHSEFRIRQTIFIANRR